LVDPHSTEDLAGALERLIADSDLRDEYSKRGRERAKLYPWERSIRETYRVYKELMS
jgi:glycosyltransferase involved in cell wall biosynthesis